MRKIILSFALLSLVASCTKETLSPDFEVSTASDTYSVNETITFDFKGNPDIITFYSGLAGNNYDLRERTQVAGSKLRMNFNSLGQRDEGDISLLVSTDFAGKADANSITAATWTDISSKAVFSTGADQTPSGLIDLASFSNTGKPVTIAFKYASKKIKAPNSRWVIRSISIDNVTAEGAVSNLATMATTGWLAYSFKNPAANWAITTAQLLMDGGTTELDEDWVISKGFEAGIVKPDVGVGLKNIATTLDSYQFKFPTAGTYKVVFVAANSRGLETRKIVREITLTIKN